MEGAGGARATKRSERGMRLDAEKILAAALAVADEGGLPRMTMRRVGERLGADPTAVYRYFPSKDDLIAAMADRLFAEVPRDVPSGGWRERLEHVSIAARNVYRAHPAIVEALANQDEDTQSLRHINEVVFGCLREAGVSDRDAGLFHQVFVSFAIGDGMLEAAWDGPDGDSRAATRRAYAALPPEDYPNTTAVAAHLFPPADEVFEIAVAVLLDAVEERARASAGRKQPRGRTKP